MENYLQINAPSKTSPNPSKGGECQTDDGKERKEKPPPTPPKEGSAKQMTEKNERKNRPRPLQRRGETNGVMI